VQMDCAYKPTRDDALLTSLVYPACTALRQPNVKQLSLLCISAGLVFGLLGFAYGHNSNMALWAPAPIQSQTGLARPSVVVNREFNRQVNHQVSRPVHIVHPQAHRKDKTSALYGINDDDEETYIGTYSNFWEDFSQIRGIIIFCSVLIAFFAGGNILSGLLLPFLLGDGDLSQLGTFDYWFKF